MKLRSLRPGWHLLCTDDPGPRSGGGQSCARAAIFLCPMARPARHGAGAWPIPRRHGGCPGNHRPAAGARVRRRSGSRPPIPAPAAAARESGSQTAFTDAENILAFPAQNLPDELAAEPCLANDPPDRHAIISHLTNHPVGLLAAQIALVLQLFGSRQQLWFQFSCSERFADGRHVPLYSGQESRACMLRGLRGRTAATVLCAFQQVPAIGTLKCFWQGL